MSNRTARLKELGEFLKVRRAELSPDQMGLPDKKAVRRVPGLRREEVAMLAAISTDYDTQLERGRLQASAPVLEDLARVLRSGAELLAASPPPPWPGSPGDDRPLRRARLRLSSGP